MILHIFVLQENQANPKKKLYKCNTKWYYVYRGRLRLKENFFDAFNYFVETAGKERWGEGEVKLYLYLLKKWNDLGRENWIGVGHEEIHKNTGLAMLSITRAVKKLEERGAISRIRGSWKSKTVSKYKLF